MHGLPAAQLPHAHRPILRACSTARAVSMCAHDDVSEDGDKQVVPLRLILRGLENWPTAAYIMGSTPQRVRTSAKKEISQYLYPPACNATCTPVAGHAAKSFAGNTEQPLVVSAQVPEAALPKTPSPVTWSFTVTQAVSKQLA